eukprot:6439958-Lingulodinium_polyedra.AAC.1
MSGVPDRFQTRSRHATDRLAPGVFCAVARLPPPTFGFVLVVSRARAASSWHALLTVSGGILN